MRQGETDEVYSRSAEVYDLIYQKIMDYDALAAAVVAAIDRAGAGAASLLEIGCGTGLYLERLAGRFDELVGLDLSQPMLDRAAARCPGVELHRSDMTHFDLGREFDVVACLASSIGYVRDRDGLRRSIAAMERHTRPGGVVVVEPWFRPDAWDPKHIGAHLFEYDDIKIARINTSQVDAGCSVMDMHHLVVTRDGAEVFTERHVMGLFTIEEHLEAFNDAGLDATYDPEGPLGRGLYVASKPELTRLRTQRVFLAL